MRSFLHKLYLSEHLNWLFNSWYWIICKKEMLQRVFFWGWKMRWSWDFDANTIYKMLEMKLNRCYDCFNNHGHCIWNSSPKKRRMRELKEMVVLFRRLHEDEYDLEAYDLAQITPKNKKEIYNASIKKREAHKDRAFYLLKRNIDYLWD